MAAAKKQKPPPPCPYGTSCYRRNPAHRLEFSHPGDSATASASGSSSADGINISPPTVPVPVPVPVAFAPSAVSTSLALSLTDSSSSSGPHAGSSDASHLPPCPFGLNCYRKNLVHFAEYSHLPNAANAASSSSSSSNNRNDKKRKTAVVSGSSAGGVFDHATALPTPFVVGDYGSGHAPKTLVELRLMSLSAAIRSKPDWEKKRKVNDIVTKWRQEAKQQQHVSDTAFNYVMEELDFYAELKQRLYPIEMSPVDGVYQADHLIPAVGALKEALMESVAVLEKVPAHKLDWHPGSNQQVLDIVHPSLFPLVYGVTRKLERSHHTAADGAADADVDADVDADGTTRSSVAAAAVSSAVGVSAAVMWQRRHMLGGGDTIPALPAKPPPKAKGMFWSGSQESNDYSVSRRFQWLPTDVAVDAAGHVTILSYINNLDPIDHHDLYGTIGAILERFIPLFNQVLTDLHHPRPNRISDRYEEDDDFQDPDEHDGDNEEEEQDSDEYFEPPAKPPKVPAYVAPDPPEEVVDLRGRQLQVIFKLANIVVTPDKPSYPGGVWHVEGMENEHIVASGIYYYHSDNISTSMLAFREAVCEPSYEQGDNVGVRRVYGLNDEAPLNQELGAVETRGDRCIAFPNVFQHRVAPFQLIDASRPGIRKILVMFLVDPHQRITSTAEVPSQQRDWYVRELEKQPLGELLPPSLVELIVEFAGWPMTLDEAKQYREELMAERKYFIQQNTELLFERPFSLCEH